MAGDERSPRDAEDRLLRRFRIISGIVVLACVVFLVILSPFPQFHVDELIFGTLIGALLALVGLEGVQRLPFGRNGK